MFQIIVFATGVWECEYSQNVKFAVLYIMYIYTPA